MIPEDATLKEMSQLSHPYLKLKVCVCVFGVMVNVNTYRLFLIVLDGV